MGRSYSEYDYEPDYDNADALYHQAVCRAMEGKRGQKMLRDLAAALDAMPVKRLVCGRFIVNGEVCALGALGTARGVDMEKLDELARQAEEDEEIVEYLRREAAKTFGIAESMAGSIMDHNDTPPFVFPRPLHEETPEERWVRMRAWVASKIRSSEELEET